MKRKITALHYRNKERRWNVYHKFEEKDKKSFLKKLSASEGFRILDGLYRFAHKLGSKSSFKKLDMDKIKTLAKVHAIFNKIKV